ncbi:hypothetical protein B0H66DRAFT_171294 [Apodospora peruviana]|uniref:Uncharacterized protein n=1 Tax=Apodospora peruviana TaxID=516989 RepID=A0AAE0IL30_9PEZI|nr:hypothetical protein B0H66DRAFT_171294 [Apodospora peruviana]
MFLRIGHSDRGGRWLQRGEELCHKTYHSSILFSCNRGPLELKPRGSSQISTHTYCLGWLLSSLTTYFRQRDLLTRLHRSISPGGPDDRLWQSLKVSSTTDNNRKMRVINTIASALLIPAMLDHVGGGASANSVTPPSDTTSSSLPRHGNGNPLRHSTATSPTPANPTTLVLLPPSGPNTPLAQPTSIPARLDLRNRDIRRHLGSRGDDAEEPELEPTQPEAPPLITPASGGAEPETDRLGLDANGAAVRFVQTTYYSCVTQGTYSHCGWHIPILDASSAASRIGTKREAGGMGGLALRVAIAAAGVVAIVGLVVS